MSRMKTALSPTLSGSLVLVLLWMSILLASCAAGRYRHYPRPQEEPVVRIGVVVDAGQLVVSCDGYVRVWRRGSGEEPLLLGPNLHLRCLPSRMAPAVWASTAGQKTVPEWGVALSDLGGGRLGAYAEELLIEPVSENEPIRVEGKAYRGEVLVLVARPERLTAINVLHIEDYLRGVVPPEVGRSPHLPAAVLRAQAIAARSYTLFYMGRHEKLGFDLMATPVDQVYEGYGAETAEADAAIAATRGVVAVYKGHPIRANYSSTCGGRTEASGRVWPGESFPYLRSIHDRVAGSGDLCEASPHYRWTETWDCRELHGSILDHLAEEDPRAAEDPPTRIHDLEIEKRSPSGRAERLAIRTDTGTYHVHGDRIRWILRRPRGLGPLRSTLIRDPRRSGASERCTITIEGAGYGHGVGLCQNGAIEMARRGRSAPEILHHYYRGIDLVRWW